MLSFKSCIKMFHSSPTETLTVCESLMSVSVLPSCVPQQARLFTEGLGCSLTKKMLIQHIPNMFTYREEGGWQRKLCVCERTDMISSHWPSVCVVLCWCVCAWVSECVSVCYKVHRAHQEVITPYLSGHWLRGGEKSIQWLSEMQTEKEWGFYTERGTDPREGWGEREESDMRKRRWNSPSLPLT